jgi:hypothetical protein
MLLFATNVFPEASVNRPDPTGPFLITVPLKPVPPVTRDVTFVLDPINTPPLVPVVVNPPVKVFAPLNCNNPFPAFVMEAAFAPKNVTSVAAPIVLFAFPPSVSVVPLIDMTMSPKRLEPTTNPAGTLVTVTAELPVLLVKTFTVPAVFASVITEEMFKLATKGAYPTPLSWTGFTVIVFAPDPKAKNPPVTTATFAALFELAVIGLELLNNRVDSVGTVTEGAASPPGFVNVKLLNRFHAFESAAPVGFPANVKVPRPLIVTLLVDAICCAFVFIITKAPVPAVPPLMIKSPGITGLSATNPAPPPTKFKVPWFMIVPPVYVFAALRFSVPAPDFTNTTLFPIPLSAITELITMLLWSPAAMT